MSDTSPSDYLQRTVWVSLHRIHDLMVKLEGDAFSRKGAVSYQQLSILLAIESAGGSITAIELSHQLGRNPNTISMIVDRMEKQTLIKREHSQKDRRLVYVQLTPSGREVLEQAMEVERELVNRIAGVLSDEELRLFNQLLDKIGSQAAREIGSLEVRRDIGPGTSSE